MLGASREDTNACLTGNDSQTSSAGPMSLQKRRTKASDEHKKLSVSSRNPFRTSGNYGNATFLTECSFAVSHDRLVQLITDVEPYEPCWENLQAVDLSSKGVDSLVRLKEFLPQLDEADL